MPFGVLDFIDADGVDLAERPVLETLGDNMFDRVENLVRRCERPPPSLSMTVAAPNGLRRAWRLCQCALAVAPGNFLDSHNATAATVDAPHGVQKEEKKPHKGMNSKRRSMRWSYPGAGKWQREQTAAEPLRGRTATSMLFLSALK